MTITDVRERLTLCAEGPVPGPEWSTEPGLDAVAVRRDDLRALLDDHARLARAVEHPGDEGLDEAEARGIAAGRAEYRAALVEANDLCRGAEVALSQAIERHAAEIERLTRENAAHRAWIEAAAGRLKVVEAEVERLTLERDEWTADHERSACETCRAAALAEVERQWTYGLTRLDRAESALAEVREAAAEAVRQQLGDDLTWWTPERRDACPHAVSLAALRLADALAATPADLAAAHDARVRAEAYADGVMAGRATMARDAAAVASAVAAEPRVRHCRSARILVAGTIADRIRKLVPTRAEAERIERGGR